MVEQFAMPDQAWLLPQFDVAAKRISYVVHAYCLGMCGQSKPTGVTGRFQVYFDFRVENLEEHLIIDESSPDPIPTHEMMVMLGGVAYSTARGMLLSKVESTPLHGFALPLRGPVQLLEASVKRMLEQQTEEVTVEPKKLAKPRSRKNS